jgi:hypothetical protein
MYSVLEVAIYISTNSLSLFSDKLGLTVSFELMVIAAAANPQIKALFILAYFIMP